MSKVKVRFAPSPTGPLHIGGARSALFNYFFAAKEAGEMLLRIEDTDLERSRVKYEEEIIQSLKWLGITWTEGIGVSHNSSAYRQTERLNIYQEYVQKLFAAGYAYYCFCSEEELEEERKTLSAAGETPRYLGRCRSLSPEEREEKMRQGIRPTIRFQVPPNRLYIVDDLVRGRVSFESDIIGDFIIVKSDGMPVYNFAVVIDDALMGITHVIRAEEHLSNTPRQLMLYDALNFKRPKFAHISLILGDDRQKMSKRHGATSIMQYREMGYLPEAMLNFLALLGWAPPGEEQILSKEQIIEAFSLDRLAKNPAVFDLDKLNWINQQYIKKLSTEELIGLCRPFLLSSQYKEQVNLLSSQQLGLLVEAVRDRLVCLKDIQEEAGKILAPPVYEGEVLEILKREGVNEVLNIFSDRLPLYETLEEISQGIKDIIKQLKLKPREVYMPLRCALSGTIHGPELPYLIAVLGKEETSKRIKASMSL